jgi:uncharacterized membrane protein (DUF2068 family)
MFILVGHDVTVTGTFTKIDIFPAFRWAGWVMALAGVIFLAYGIYDLLGRNRKNHISKNNSDLSDESE